MCGEKQEKERQKELLEVRGLTRITFPIKIFLWITVALQLQSHLLACRAVRKWDVKIGNVIEEVDLFFFQHQPCRDRVDRGVSPPLVVKATSLVEKGEKVEIGFRAEPVEVCNLKVGPLKH